MSIEVCMNPNRPCEECIFNTGHLARWCQPEERAAKIRADLLNATRTLMELEKDTGHQHGLLAGMDAETPVTTIWESQDHVLLAGTVTNDMGMGTGELRT